MTPSPTPAPSPLPVLRKVANGWAQDKVTKGIDWVLVALLGASVLAARATDGALRLAFGVLVFAAFVGVGQVLGARLADRSARKGFGFFLSGKWWFIALLVVLPTVLGLAGIAYDQALRMLVGAAIGLGAVVTVWLGWLLVARRRPDLLYLPETPPLWWLRGTSHAGALLGVIIALALDRS